MSTINTLIAHHFVGNFHSDQQAILAFGEFIDNPANSVQDRATALRYLAVNCYGFDGEDAGEGVTDETYVQLYMDMR